MSRVSRLLSRRVQEDGDGIIPSDAKPFKPREQRDTDAAKARKLEAGDAKEPLIDPEVALVAPDATPRATVRLSPSQVPSEPESTLPAPTEAPAGGGAPRPDAISVMLGRARRDNSPTPMTIPGFSATPESYEGDDKSGGVALAESHAGSLAAAVTPGGGMPDPAPRSDGAAVYSAFRRFGGPRG